MKGSKLSMPDGFDGLLLVEKCECDQLLPEYSSVIACKAGFMLLRWATIG
jgi:hypothetical protein